MSSQLQHEFSCPFCSRKMKNRSGPTQHISNAHSGPRKNERTVQKAPVCEDSPPMGHEPLLCTRDNHTILDGKIPECNAHGWMSKGYDVWFRDPNAVVKTLLGNPDFHNHFDYVPYREFEPTGQHHWENFMSGNWAWCHVDILAKDPAMHGAMLVPVILGQNDYYPLYLSIGNVHNNTCRAHHNAVVLLAFLAIPKSM
ncbi:hypothetical protein EDD15DRAFT_2201065 [Pisolithus albus]|nr:hypothetical protein EDD15DRAFT_2201065 [Pisolithus albus]